MATVRPLIDRIDEAHKAVDRQRERIAKARGTAARVRAIGRAYKAVEKLDALEERDRLAGCKAVRL